MITLVGATSLQANDVKALNKHAAANEARVVDRISDRFENFAGSEDNALALVIGLRAGGEITLVETTPETIDPETGEFVDAVEVETVFTPAKSPLGYGEIYLALGLAQASLSKLGILEPTSADVVASLNGGVVLVGDDEFAEEVELVGVLALRAENHGWGKIAKETGVKLGAVKKALKKDVSALKSKKKRG